MGDFVVTVEGKDYDVTAPDEKTAWRWANATHAKVAPPQPKPAIADRPYSRTNIAGAAVEPSLTLGSGMIAAPLGGLAGLAGTVLPGPVGQGAEWSQGVSSALTYQPQTEGGKTALGAIAYPFEKLAEGADWAGGKATDITGSPAIGTAVNTAVQAAPMLAGARYLPATPRIMESAPVRALTAIPRNLFGPVEGRAGRVLSDVAGENRDAVIKALLAHQDRIPGSVATAGQAATPAGSAEFSALQEIIANRAPSKYGSAGIEGEQEAARQAAIGTIAKTPVDLEAAIKARTAATAPLRETALENANIAGIKAPELAAKIADRGAQASEAASDVRRLSQAGETADALAQSGRMRLGAEPPPVEGLPRIAGRYSYGNELAGLAERKAQEAANVSLQRGAERRFAEMQAGSLEAHGLKPLESGSVVRQITRIQNIPGNKTNTTLQKAMGEIKDLIRGATDNNGVIDARELYTIRKSEAGNVITKFAQENKNWDQRYTAGLLKDVQGIIDEAITHAGGTGWKDYLATYAEKSKPINRMETGQAVSDALTSSLGIAERPTVFANLVKKAGEETGIGTGKPRIADLTPQEQSIIEAVKAELARDAQYGRMAKEGAPEATRRIGAELPEAPGVGVFAPKINVMRALYNRFVGKAQEGMLRYLTEKAHDPREIARIMQNSTPAQRSAIADALMRRANVGALQETAGQQ